MLNKAHMMEITKANKVPFRKAIDSLVAQYREECVNWQKNRIVKKKNVKLPANRFSLTSKSCYGSTNLFIDDLLSDGLHEKVMICY